MLLQPGWTADKRSLLPKRAPGWVLSPQSVLDWRRVEGVLHRHRLTEGSVLLANGHPCRLAALDMSWLAASVNRFNAFACMFLQCCSTLSLVSGYSLHFRVFIAALRQAYKTTRAPSSPPLLFVSSSSRLLLFCSSSLLLVSSSARLLHRPRRSLTAPPLFVFYMSAREVERLSFLSREEAVRRRGKREQ
jgi:hypothetical protein